MIRLFLPLTIILMSLPQFVAAQVPGKHFPLNHRQRPGVAAQWNALVQPGAYGQPQAISVSLPEGGVVSFYQDAPGQEIPAAAPAQVTFFVGHVYRLKLSAMPDYPGVELYPTVELIDRLHPPAELRDQFPVPIQFTPEEIEAALNDRLITKVVYLEQPEFAVPLETRGSAPVEELPESQNLLAAADHRGRPLAIVRLGSRIPDPASSVDEFYSRSPILFTGAPASATVESLPVDSAPEITIPVDPAP
jgi:hypothetical protein